MKRRILLVLTVIMLLLLAACGRDNEDTPSETGNEDTGGVANETASDTTEIGRWPAYVNLGTGDNYMPVILPGVGDDVVITMAVAQASTGGNWDDLWVSSFFENYMNINFQVEQIMTSALSERKSLMFAANDLPDVMINLEFTPTEIFQFGQLNGQLLDVLPFIDPELTPHIYATLNERPDVRSISTTPDGRMYSLPNIFPANEEGSVSRIFVDSRWLDAVGLQTPQTLDEFINMLRAFKEHDPTGVGSDNVVPLGGVRQWLDPSWYIFNALGYVDGTTALSPALRNGQVEIPATNPELFLEYLTIMNTLYTEGLIDGNFFLAPGDGLESIGQLLENRMGVLSFPVFAVGYPDWVYWEALPPLTSNWQPNRQWPAPPSATLGGFAMSATARHPEAIMRFADAYYSEYARMLFSGPAINDYDRLFGHTGAGIHWNPETRATAFDMSFYPEGIDSAFSFIIAHMTPFVNFGNLNDRRLIVEYANRFIGGDMPMERTLNPENPDDHYRISVIQNNMPYIMGGFPRVFFVDESTTLELTDLETVIGPFIEEQVALFATGRRSLDEFDALMSELQSIGIDRLNQIYRDIWAGFN